MYQSTEEILACVRRQDEDCTTDIPLPSINNNLETSRPSLDNNQATPRPSINTNRATPRPSISPTLFNCGISTITKSSELVCQWSGQQCDLTAHVSAVHPEHWVQGNETQLNWKVNFRFTNFHLKLLSSFGDLFWCILGYWSDGLVYGHVCYVGDAAAGDKYRFEMRIRGRDGERTMKLSDRIRHVDKINRPILCIDTISSYIVDGYVVSTIEIIKLKETLL